MTLPHLISGFANLPIITTQSYAMLGVLHNGRDPFAGADTALAQFRETGGKVLLLSNAPRPGTTVMARLMRLAYRAKPMTIF